MIRYQKLYGVNLNTARDLPSVKLSPEGKAMGSIPGWRILFDPAYLVNGEPRNRAQPKNLMAIAGGELKESKFDNGEPAVNFERNIAVQPNQTLNNEAWSAFCVTKLSEYDSVPDLMASITPAEHPNIGVRIGFNVRRDAITFFEGNTKEGEENNIDRARYEVGPSTFNDQTVLVMWTFSARDGIRIFMNGRMVASNNSDKRQFDVGYRSGEWRMFRGFRGLMGMAGVLDVDLGWDEHIGYRHAIEQFLMTKYGIERQ